MTTEIMVLIVIIIIVVIMIIACDLHYRNGYKKGQIDALSGIQKYVLVEFKDGTRAYYKKSELKDLIEHKVIDS